MEPGLIVALLWLLFGGTHVGLATGRIRGALVARLGHWGFLALFSIVASLSFAALVHGYAVQRFAGAPGLGAAAWPGATAVGVVFIVVSFAVLFGSLAVYPRSPMAMFNAGGGRIRGLERISRHPFFIGVAMLGLAHALLATRLAGAVFFGGLALFAVLGAMHQDRKLLREQGESYRVYRASTSLLPFGAILARRQSLVWSELPWLPMSIGAAVAVLLRFVHDSILAYGGLFVVAAVVGGAAREMLEAWLRSRRAVPALPGARLPHAGLPEERTS